ncbi:MULTISPECIES: DUF3152 domain-containing protein [Streptomyces]|uniref:DUF3152 domain-containing protein n=1 Tax=Streptomyces solicathayae TaxID=3081768 RepID=A0ABZ0LRS2_9ACTN|nr:DUF3152 domain-containing protein [Streptomyces sp. HUAS YS2]WOX22196.1 DUF3152 domain-containing protein [Streptomyces sp. HUAS YS2]
MGRHSRKGPAPAAVKPGEPEAARPGSGRRRRSGGAATETPPHGTPGYGTEPYGTPAHGTPAYGGQDYGTPAHGTPGYGTPAPGTPSYGTPSYGTPAHGTPAYGRQDNGRPDYGTPAHGTPSYGAQGYAARPGGPYGGALGGPAGPGPDVRGGHPQHPEGAPPPPQRYGDWQGVPRHRAGGPAQTASQTPFIPAPRRETLPQDLEAFDDLRDTDAEPRTLPDEEQPPAKSGGKGRTLTGVAAAAVTTVLAVVVAGQVAGGTDTRDASNRSAGEAGGRAVEDAPRSDRSDDRATPSQGAPVKPAVPLTYDQLMARQFPIDPKLKASGDFEAVPGFDKAPGKGRKIRYRVDVEKGLGLDPALFAKAVQKTLNDERSWAGKGEMTFERISSGDPEFVITLASPGTTGVWCEKSGLDTTVDNVSCDSASTQRVMINAFRWAQGSETFGPKAMYAYRQMLINHEVGHRLGHGHVSCRTPGALAPVMQQQTKSLDIDGIECRPNPWVHPGS